MRKGIVEGNDYSVLPVFAIRLVRRLQSALGLGGEERKGATGAAPGKSDEDEADP